MYSFFTIIFRALCRVIPCEKTTLQSTISADMRLVIDMNLLSYAKTAAESLAKCYHV